MVMAYNLRFLLLLEFLMQLSQRWGTLMVRVPSCNNRTATQTRWAGSTKVVAERWRAMFVMLYASTSCITYTSKSRRRVIQVQVRASTTL